MKMGNYEVYWKDYDDKTRVTFISAINKRIAVEKVKNNNKKNYKYNIGIEMLNKKGDIIDKILY